MGIMALADRIVFHIWENLKTYNLLTEGVKV